MPKVSSSQGITKLLAKGLIALSLIVDSFWVRHILLELAYPAQTYLRLIPFILGFAWSIWKVCKFARDPITNSMNSGPVTFLFLTFLSISTPIASQDFLLMSLLALVFVVFIFLIEQFEERIKARLGAK